MRSFIETAKILSETILGEGEVRELAPDVGAIIEVYNDDGTIDAFAGRPRTYRVNGWMKAAPPLPVTVFNNSPYDNI